MKSPPQQFVDHEAHRSVYQRRGIGQRKRFRAIGQDPMKFVIFGVDIGSS
jgi:hypothetical protein